MAVNEAGWPWRDFERTMLTELEHAQKLADEEDECMVAAARGEPFWRTGPTPTHLVGFDAFIPPIERCIRCSITHDAWTVEPGIEWREGDDFNAVSHLLQSIALKIAEWCDGDPMSASRRGESVIRLHWPDRAFFVEIHDAECSRWTQSYQPYGLPRRR